MKHIHHLPPLALFATFLLSACGAQDGQDPTAELRAASGKTTAEIDRDHILYIDQACVISPRPKMAEASAVFEYDYYSAGGVQGLSPMTADFKPESSTGGGTIVITDSDNNPGLKATVAVNTPYKISIAWSTDSATERPIVNIDDVTDPQNPVSVIQNGTVSKISRWVLPVALHLMYLDNKLPHVMGWPVDAKHQWVYVKTGGFWVGLYMSRP